LADSLATQLEERRAQAELAMMTPHERFDLDVTHGNLIGSECDRSIMIAHGIRIGFAGRHVRIFSAPKVCVLA
jgi:hypothetical protein